MGEERIILYDYSKVRDQRCFSGLLRKGLHKFHKCFAAIIKFSFDQNIFNHIGDWNELQSDDIDRKKQHDFNLNVGRALETLRRELPMAFYVSSLDFSIFANQIAVCDGTHKNRVVMQKSLYAAAVKSLRVAASVSFTYPSMNVRKIEYIDSCRTIQCNVDIVLPDTIRIDGQVV